jgi:hypothetical protein
VIKWTSLVETYDRGRGGTDTHHPQEPGSSPDNRMDMIIYEMAALSIRQEELQRALQDQLLERERKSSNSGTVQVSSSQSIPSSVSRTQLDELAPRSQQSPARGLSSSRSSPFSRDGWRSYLRRQPHQD